MVPGNVEVINKTDCMNWIIGKGIGDGKYFI